MDKKQSKEQVTRLIEKYKKILEEGRIKEYNEAQTRNEFIEPLFESLGWDMRNLNSENEVSTEETTSKGRIDLAFRLNGIPQFFLEAKPLKADLDNEDYARQAINYSWNKGVTWAVLTDFEGLKIFNAQAESRLLSDKLVFELKWDTYLEDFDRLWLLSKESFKENKLDEYAVKYGKKIKKLTVNEKLFKDLTSAREILTKSFKLWNEKVDQETLDEGVQRILDRLVFIRVLEDKGLEPPTLKEILHNWEADKKSKQFFPLLIDKFRELDDIYNSNLFTEHPCEEWEEYDDSLKKVILMLYGNNVYEYDFKEIPADILGGVYENYLSYVQTRSDAKGKARAKRKEHGIYYTPRYIVEYIVNNTLGKKLEDINSVHQLKQLKVLDPACGSGSFLTKSLVTINNKYKDFGNKGDQFTKSEILLSNIYGVDLDTQAVELARLNLLIDALDKKAKLPNLTGNIRQGNSLISGEAKELEKYFGKNYRELHPFNWQEQFKEVFDKGGFDVIIGNPPYVRQEAFKELKPYFENAFPDVYSGMSDLYIYFFERSMQLLKNGGLFGFIVSNKFIRSGYGENLRKYIRNNFKILSLVDKFENKVFADAAVDPCIIILQKEKPEKSHKVIYNYTTKVLQSSLSEKGWTFADSSVLNLKKKIESAGKKIKDWEGVKIYFGIKSGLNEAFIINEKIKNELVKKDKEALEIIKPILRGRDIERYKILFANLYLIVSKIGLDIKKYKSVFEYLEKFKSQLLKRTDFTSGVMEWFNLRPCDYYEKFDEPKIIYPDISEKGGFYWDNECYFFNNTIYMIAGKVKKSWVAVLNSKLMSWYYPQIASGLGEKGVRYFTQFVKELPLPENTQSLEKYAQEMFDLNKKLQAVPENSEKWLDSKREIEKLDRKIDEEVYKLYGLSEEEIKIIKGS